MFTVAAFNAIYILKQIVYDTTYVGSEFDP